jgi:hypothetical protein
VPLSQRNGSSVGRGPILRNAESGGHTAKGRSAKVAPRGVCGYGLLATTLQLGNCLGNVAVNPDVRPVKSDGSGLKGAGSKLAQNNAIASLHLSYIVA